MIFQYSKWDEFCSMLDNAGIHSIPASEVFNDRNQFLVLKHDVETDVLRAFKLAEIEKHYGHRGSYYVQAYLMKDKKNISLLKEMQEMGHEISYHYDVMDSNKGDLNSALIEFEHNVKLFEDCGFHIITVCQHGNPVVERVGYTSNRDFFRSEIVQKKYAHVADIMVDFKFKSNSDYDYYSDAGRSFKKIYDPINNDVINSDDKNIPFADLKDVFQDICGKNAIISTHPHRWTKNAVEYTLKTYLFRAIKFSAKKALLIPGAKKIMSRYYYLAKKF